MRASDIVGFWAEHGLKLGEEEGFRFGTPEVALSGVLVAWMATLDAIQEAHERNCNLMIVHEDLFYPPGYTRYSVEKHLSGRVNSRRLSALARHGIAFFRAHSSLDVFCVLDDFARVLGLPEPSVRERFYRVYDIDPVSVAELAAQAQDHLQLPSVRVVGDLERQVRRVGLPWGGLGLSYNAGFQEMLFGYGVDVLIAGEADDYAMHAALDAGTPLIETGHAASEDPGLRHFAQVLDEYLPGVAVGFYPTRRPWKLVRPA